MRVEGEVVVVVVFNRARSCAASRILVSGVSVLEARRVMIVSCAPVVEEVRVHQGNAGNQKQNTHLLEFLNLSYVQSLIALTAHHCLGQHQAQ